jgi:hypothetical protein
MPPVRQPNDMNALPLAAPIDRCGRTCGYDPDCSRPRRQPPYAHTQQDVACARLRKAHRWVINILFKINELESRNMSLCHEAARLSMMQGRPVLRPVLETS